MKKAIVTIIVLLGCGSFLSAFSSKGGPLSEAQSRIEKVRMREVTLKLVGPGDGGFAGVSGRAEMTGHQFLFGCNIFMFGKFPTAEENDRYLELWSDLFNYATVPFYFAGYEPSPDETREARLQKMSRWCVDRGIKVKGHPLVWHYPAGSPDWLPRDPQAVEKIHEERVRELVAKFAPEIQSWDVLNEPTVAWMYDTKVADWINGIGPLASSKKALDWAYEANPEATLLINDYNVRYDLWSALGLLHPAKSIKHYLRPINHYPNSYYRLMEDLKGRGGRYNAVGIQSHMHQGGNWSMQELWNTCERYSGLGVPVHFTEVTVISGQNKIMWPFNPEVNLPWPSTKKGEAAQEEYVRDFYTLLFSHPSVEAITWWDFSDRDAWMGAPAGLVRDDLSPKPAYETLLYLVKEKWWTDREGRFDDRGMMNLHGYCGDYLLHLEGETTPLPFSIDCSDYNGKVIEISVES